MREIQHVHEYRRFIQTQLDERGWKPAELARKSGLSKQLISDMLKDDRDHLGRMPNAATINALAHGFNIPSETVRTAAARSLVDYSDDGTALTITLNEVSTDALLNEIRRRIDNADLPALAPATAEGTPNEATEDQKIAAIQEFVVLDTASLADVDDLLSHQDNTVVLTYCREGTTAQDNETLLHMFGETYGAVAARVSASTWPNSPTRDLARRYGSKWQQQMHAVGEAMIAIAERPSRPPLTDAESVTFFDALGKMELARNRIAEFNYQRLDELRVVIDGIAAEIREGNTMIEQSTEDALNKFEDLYQTVRESYTSQVEAAKARHEADISTGPDNEDAAIRRAARNIGQRARTTRTRAEALDPASSTQEIAGDPWYDIAEDGSQDDYAAVARTIPGLTDAERLHGAQDDAATAPDADGPEGGA